MGLLKTIKNLFTSSKKKEEKTAGTTSQSSPASGRTVVVGKSLVKLPAATDTKTDTKSRKSGTTESKSGSTGQKSGTGSTKTDNTAEKKSTGTRNNGTSSDGTKVAVGKTSVTLPKTGEIKKTETSLSSAWQNHKEKMQQKQLEGIQKQKERQQDGPVTEGNSIAAIVNRGLQGFNEKQQEKNAAEKAEKQQEYQLEMLYGAVQTYEKQLTALKNKAERDPESITQADVDQYNTWWEQYQTVIGNYNNVVEKIQTKQAQKEQDQQKIRAALGLDAGIVDAPQAGNQSVFDIDPQKYAQDVEKTNEGASVAAQQLRAQLPKTLAAIGTAGVASAQDALANAMGMGENIVWALSPGAQKDAASAADHAKQVQAWKAEQQNAKDKMQKAFELTEDDQLGQFLVELNYNFVQQGAAMVAGGAIGKAGGTALRAAGGAYKAAGANMAGKIGSQAAQRAAAAADLSGKALQGAAKYLQKNAGLATMATLAGSTNYQAAIEGGASNEQAMAYAVLTAAAETVTEKLFGGNPLMDNESGLVNRALYKMLGDRKFLKALDSMPVEVFNEGFEEVIANYLYSGAQAVTGQKVELPTARENLHSFALGAAMGGIGQATKAASGTVNQALEDREIGKKLQEMGAADELIATGLELPGSRAQMRAKELQMKGSLPTARELGRQYRENVAAQKLLTARQMDTERTVRQMAQDVGAQVVFDDAIANAAGKDNAANGYYQNGVLHISRDADQPAMVVAKHELTHYLQQAAGTEYNAFRDYAMAMAGDGAVQQMQERYARGGVTLSEEEAMDEIAADFTEQLLTDSGSIKQLINTNPTLADRFFAALREFLRKLTGRVDPKLKKAEQLWTDAYKAAQGNKNTAREGGEKRYSFGGQNAGTADVEKLNRAVELQRDGADMERIRKETGWYTGADGKWRFEIDDSGMKYHRGGDAAFSRNHPEYAEYQNLTQKMLYGTLTAEEQSRLMELNDVWGREYGRLSERVDRGNATLEDILDHEALFQAYPQLRETRIVFAELPDGTRGQYDDRDNTIRLSKELRTAPEDTLIHEIQNVIQHQEGFAVGSSPEYWAVRDAESGEIKNRLRMQRRDLFRGLNREDQNKYTRYQELERELERLTYAEDGTEDAERYVRYDKESDRLYLELWGKEWFQKLSTLDRKLESGMGEEYRKLYRNTAGEIEARDAANRRAMTQEQRRETKPDTGDENTVFAEDEGKNGIRYSLKSFADGKRFVDVQTDQEQFDGLSITEMNNLANKIIKRKYGNKVIGTDNTVFVNGRSAKKYVYYAHGTPDDVIEAKARASTELDNLIDAGTNFRTRPDGADGHVHADVIGGFSYFDTIFKVGTQYYKGVINIKNIGNGRLLWGVTKTENITQDIYDSYGENPTVTFLRDVSMKSVLQNNDSVKKYSLKRDRSDLKSLREERKQVRDQIGHLEWLEERAGSLTAEDAEAMADLRARERELTERIDAKMRAAKSQHGTEAERILKKGAEEAAAVRPTEAKKTLRSSLLDTFSIQAGSRKALGAKIDDVAEQILQKGYASASDEAELFRSLYNAGIVVDTTSSREYAEIRNDLKGVKLYVDPDIKAELGDSWNDVRNQAWGNRITLTTQEGEGIGIDVEHARLADTYPGMFDSYATDRTEMLEQMLRAAELGRPEHISLMESAMREGGEDAVAQQMMFFDKYLSNALTNFSEQAGFEMRIKQGEILKSAKLRAATADAVEKQSRRKALAEAQNKTLRVFQQLRKMRKTENAETQKLIDELVGGFDTMAKSLRKDKEATWRNLRDIYEAKKREDPNFLPDKDLEAKFARLDQIRIGEMSREEAVELYRAGTQLIHDIRTANKEIAEKNARDLSKLYEDSVAEIRSSQGDLREYSKTEKGREKLKGVKRRYWNEEQLSPMNYIEKMGGWRRDGEFYSMAKKLERGEYDKQRFIVHSDALMEKFTKENADWIAKADGKGKDAIWYEVEVPAIFERGRGNERIEEMKTVKIFMTPMIKVKLYLDSLSYDNLRHIRYGGHTFPNKKLCAAGNKNAAYAQGTTVKLQPEIVKNLVKDLTPQEKELARIIGDQYFNGYAKKEINRTSNLLVGYDKAMADYYSPIFTNHNFLSNNVDAAIMDATIEGGGMLKNRIWSGTPSLAVSVMDAYEQHRDFTAKYVGLAIPVRNMNALLNYTEAGYTDSMLEVISKKWGAESGKYLQDLLVNLQNKPTEETTIGDDIVNKAMNNYVTAVFGFNPGTVVKQAPGFYMAGARLGFDTMPATSLFLPSLSKYRDLIGKYTPLLEWRARGYSSREMAELRNNPNWTQKNAATRFIFGGAIQWMDLHTCAAVWPWAENYVKKHYPELKPGSKAQIDAGKDPFYQKVAEVFEDAIANSQPMYDDMHTAKILHTNKRTLRGITMFHTAQMTQANAIRQAHGELKRAMEDAKKQPTKENTAAVKRGQRALVNGVTALLVSTLGFEAVGALVAVLKRKDKALRDEDGELTPESVGKYMADATVKDLLGNIVGWDTAYDLGTHVFFGETWYGFEMPGMDVIEDLIDDAAALKKAGQAFMGGISDVSDTGEFRYYLKTGGSDLRKSLKNIGMDLSYIFGVPAKNMETYTLGLMGWINPELAAAYDNATGEYTKATMAGLKGKPREQQAALRQILKNRAADVSDEAVEELQRLYGTAGTEILPSAVPGSVSVKIGEDISESINLTNKQKVDYKAAYSKTVSDGLNELVTSEAYQKLDDEQKAGAVAMLYQYASEQGKAAAVDGYEPTGWKSKAADAAREGASISQMMIYKAATAEIVSEKDENGDTIDGSTARQKADWLQSSGWSEDAQAAIYFADAASESRLENRDALAGQGVSQAEYYRYLIETADVKADQDDNGKTVAGSKNKKLYEALDAMNLNEEQKAALYVAEIDDFTDDADYRSASEEGVSDWQYASFKANTGAMASDKDSSGKTISGTKKKKVLDYINSMDIGNDAKDALYYAAGYKESTISDAPWRGGSVKTGSSGSKKAATAAKKAAARAAAANSPAVQAYLQKYGGGTVSLPKAGETVQQGTLPTAKDLGAVQSYLQKYGGTAADSDAVQKYLQKYGG